jgi:hypothetical protein
MKKNITKLSLIIILVVVAIGITSCQSQVPCSIEVTSPGNWESLNGNGTHQITWNWVGSSNKKVNIILIGYTQSEKEMGTMLIDSNVPAADGSYLWGPNFGTSIFLNFGSDENWPWWFRIKVEVVESDVYDISDFFSVSMWN